MTVLPCQTSTLLDLAKCLLCLSETELLAVEVLMREELYADAATATVRTPEELLADSVDWTTLSAHERQAIEAGQLCADAVSAGARSNCDVATIKGEIKCYCALSKSQLEAIIVYLKCLNRNIIT